MASQLDLFGLGVTPDALDDGEVGPVVPLGVHTKRDDGRIGKRADSKAHKVTRYFPGKAPKWVAAAPKHFDEASKAPPKTFRAPQKLTISAQPRPDDSSDDDSSAEGDVVETAGVQAETAEEVAARRARVRERLGRSQMKPEEPEIESSSSSSSEEEEEEESSSEEEEEDEEEEQGGVRVTFVPRASRTTKHEARELERKERMRVEREKERRVERAEESRALVARVVTRDEREKHVESDVGSDAGAPDDTDDLDDPVEFEAWRLRELGRANRDKEEREAAAREAAETERRRALSAAERAAEDAELRGPAPVKTKWKFLQKYHHKGAFFMDEDSLDAKDVRRRDTDGAVGVDKFDRAALPQVLQVKDFGFAGRTKYTHLVDQDTTDFASRDDENPFRRSLAQKTRAKMAGQGDIDKPFMNRRRRH